MLFHLWSSRSFQRKYCFCSWLCVVEHEFVCLSKRDERVTEKEAGLKVKLFCEAGDVWRSYTTEKVSGAEH